MPPATSASACRGFAGFATARSRPHPLAPRTSPSSWPSLIGTPPRASTVCKLHSPHTAVGSGRSIRRRSRRGCEDICARRSSIRSVSSAATTSSDNLLESLGESIAEQLPAEAMTAHDRDCRGSVAPNPPAILIMSADPYVPWELARMPPADGSEPSRLSRRAGLVGRWLQDGQPACARTGRPRPPAQPPSSIR